MMFTQLNRRQFVQLGLAAMALSACGNNDKRYGKIAKGTTVLALGDSLTAGYGAAAGADYPAQLANKTAWNIINGGVSGDTTAGALSRLPDLLKKIRVW